MHDLGAGRHVKIDGLAFDQFDRRAAEAPITSYSQIPLGTGEPATKPSEGSQPIATAIGISLWPFCCQAVT